MGSCLGNGAGILPYCVRLNEEGLEEVYFLLHRVLEVSSKKLGLLVDFGGGEQEGEDRYITAAREFHEETGWMFVESDNHEIEISNLVEKLIEHDICMRVHYYSCFIHQIHYVPEEKITVFCNSQKIEKQRTFKWFSLSEMKALCTPESIPPQYPLHPRINTHSLLKYLNQL